MAKMVFGLFGMFFVVGTADVDQSSSLLFILFMLFLPCAIFMVGAHELLKLNTVTYDDK